VSKNNILCNILINTYFIDYRRHAANSQLTLAHIVDKNISFRGLLFVVDAVIIMLFLLLFPIICI